MQDWRNQLLKGEEMPTTDRVEISEVRVDVERECVE